MRRIAFYTVKNGIKFSLFAVFSFGTKTKMSRLSLELAVDNYASYTKTVEAAKNQGIAANAAMNGIKVDPNLGKSFADQITIVKTSTESLKKTIEDVKKTTDTATFKPTISRHWENEANQVAASVKKAENALDDLKNKSYTPGQPLGFTMPDAAPTAKTAFADSYKAGFDDIDARLEKTRTSFQKLADTRAGKGQFDTIYQGAFAAEKKVNDLTNRVRALRKEAADPANAQFGKQYAAGIREAERELSRLESKQRSFERTARASGGGRGRKGLGETGRAVLEFADDFVPAGLNKPFNAVVKELAKIEALSIATLAPLAAIAAIGYSIVKWSEKVRDDAARRLKYEEQIASAMNNQILGSKELIANLEKRRQLAAEDRSFSDIVQRGTTESLTARRDQLKQLYELSAERRRFVSTYGTDAEKKQIEEQNSRLSDQITAFDTQLAAIKKNNLPGQDNYFAQSFEVRKKLQEAEIQAQLKAAEIFAKSVEDGKAKVKELGETYKTILVDLYQKANSQNPFVAIFSEGEKALKSLKEQLKGLPADLQNSALSLQQRINRNALFSARLDNDLDVFDLRDRASQFRNPYDAARAAKEREDIAKRYSDAGGFFPGYGGNLGSYLSKQAGGFDKLNPNQIREIYETSLLSANNQFGGNQNALISSLATQRMRDENQNLSLNKRLQKQIGIIYGGAGSAEEKAIADRKLLSISSGLNPNEIDSNLRDKIASANEREADRRERAEKEALKLDQERNTTLAAIAANQAALLKIAEKEGLKGVNDFLEITVKDETGGGIKTLGAQPNPSDMLGDIFGSGFNQ